MTNFQAKYNELVERYANWNKGYAPHPMTVTALFSEYADGEIDFDCFEISTQWGRYYFNLDGTFEEYEVQIWQDYD